MNNQWFFKNLENFLKEDESLSLAPLEHIEPKVDTYHNPHALFFGENQNFCHDYEIDVDVFNPKADFKKFFNGVFLHLCAGLNVKLTIEGSDKQEMDKLVQVFDHFYSLLIQCCARNVNQPENGVDSGLLLLVVENEEYAKQVKEEIDLIGTGLMNEVDEALSMMISNSVNFDFCMKMKQVIKNELKILLPLGACQTYLKMGDEQYFEYQPMINYDMYMGSTLGWYRTEKVLRELVDVEYVFAKHKVKERLEEIFQSCEDLGKGIEETLRDEHKELFWEVLEKKKAYYN